VRRCPTADSPAPLTPRARINIGRLFRRR
jgi:hypothetical protein